MLTQTHVHVGVQSFLSRETNTHVDVIVKGGSDSHNQAPTHFNPRNIPSDAYSSETSIFTVRAHIVCSRVILHWKSLSRPTVTMQSNTECDCMKR